MSLTGEFCLTVCLLFSCYFLSLFPRFLLLLLGDTGPESFRVDFEERGSDAQGVVLFVFGRPFGGAQKHRLEDEHCQFSSIRLLVECPGLFGHLIVAGVFRVLQTVPLCKPARQFVWQGAQCKARYHPHLFCSKLWLHTFENVGHKAVPEGNSLLCLPVCGCLFRFELKVLLILLLLLAEVNFARSVCAYLHKSAFLYAVCMDGRLEVVTEALFGSGLLSLLRFPRNDFNVVAARNNRRLSCEGVLFRNQDEMRHLLYTLSDVRVQFPIKAPGVRARIVLDLREE